MANKDLSRKLRQARANCSLTQRQVYEKLGVKQSRFSAWENGVSEPDIKTFLELCKIYGIDDIISYFGAARTSVSENIDYSRLNDAIVKLKQIAPNFEAFESVCNCLDFEYSRDLDSRMLKFQSRRRPIPVFMQPATAGLGNYINDSKSELMELSAPSDADIGIRVSGDSMEPIICDKEIVFVKYQPSVEVGEIGIFNLNGDAYCKKLDKIHGSLCLVSINQKYLPIFLKDNDLLVTYGKVLI